MAKELTSKQKKEFTYIETVGELKKKLENIPDDFGILTFVAGSCYDGKLINVFIDTHEKNHGRNMIQIKTT